MSIIEIEFKYLVDKLETNLAICELSSSLQGVQNDYLDGNPLHQTSYFVWEGFIPTDEIAIKVLDYHGP